MRRNRRQHSAECPRLCPHNTAHREIPVGAVYLQPNLPSGDICPSVQRLCQIIADHGDRLSVCTLPCVRQCACQHLHLHDFTEPFVCTEKYRVLSCVSDAHGAALRLDRHQRANAVHILLYLIRQCGREYRSRVSAFRVHR